MSFTDLGIQKSLIDTVLAKGYTSPTPIQLEAIPAILNGQDIMAGAQTGTGKTAAFALPILHKLMSSKEANQTSQSIIKALVLTPTRELAQQVAASFTDYGTDTDIQTTVVYGGASMNTQISELKRGVDVLVATPGRLLDLIQKGFISLEALVFLVFDEADRMLDMGFTDDINRILKLVPDNRQTLLFSATFDEAVFKLSKTLLKNPQLIEVNERNAAAADVEQIAYEVNKKQKREITSFLIGSNNWKQVLVFVRTKAGADTLAKEMNKDGIKTAAIHGDKSQGARERALEDFKQNKVRALVATDVASRGLDIEQLKYVINYELPHNAEDYIHRIGRTGRAGEKGLAITLLSAEEKWLLDEVHKILNTKLLQQWLPGYEPDLNENFNSTKKPRAMTDPKRKRSNNRRNKR